MTTAPHETWQLRNGTAWVFTAGGGLSRPVVLAGDAGTDPAALAASLEDGSYAFLSELRARGRDLVLVGLPADAGISGDGGAVQEAVQRVIAEAAGDTPLAVGGTGRGALAARYALASMEYMRLDHRTGAYFSYNAAVPDLDEEAELMRLGGRPRAPMFLRMLDEGAADGLDEDEADLTNAGEAAPAGSLFSKEYGSWLLDNLPH
ncbi:MULTISPECIES: hypothetical protein [unclassified Streptomyces]|uniref:hypothetical protein n=1 Tax=unclassified Streptomyces TaxID=2593676 RepID=UPI0006FC91E3|nr:MULTISPECIES: hypothetical protein [unclassified Streptomyces]KQX57822.1 hypothetical protein ASD33_25260 [Streptomyces sp. Root1304]KRA78706.1 hypothetical protein ASE09_22815 [Streptomyces sp. Root66D1]